MSNSRTFGVGETWWARSISPSVVLPIADTVPTTRRPRCFASTRRRATFLILSGSATDEPPNFMTTVSKSTVGNLPSVRRSGPAGAGPTLRARSYHRRMGSGAPARQPRPLQRLARAPPRARSRARAARRGHVLLARRARAGDRAISRSSATSSASTRSRSRTRGASASARRSTTTTAMSSSSSSAPRTTGDADGLVEVHCFYSDRYLVTLHRDAAPTIDELRERYVKRDAPVDDPARLLHAVVDGLVDSFFPRLSDRRPDRRARGRDLPQRGRGGAAGDLRHEARARGDAEGHLARSATCSRRSSAASRRSRA